MSDKPKRRWYQFSLRSVMIAAILAPPLLAAGWILGATAINELRRRNQTEEIWEEVSGPGSMAEFSTYLHGDDPPETDKNP